MFDSGVMGAGYFGCPVLVMVASMVAKHGSSDNIVLCLFVKVLQSLNNYLPSSQMEPAILAMPACILTKVSASKRDSRYVFWSDGSQS